MLKVWELVGKFVDSLSFLALICISLGATTLLGGYDYGRIFLAGFFFCLAGLFIFACWNIPPAARAINRRRKIAGCVTILAFLSGVWALLWFDSKPGQPGNPVIYVFWVFATIICINMVYKIWKAPLSRG